MDGVLRYPAALLESVLRSRCKLWGWEGIAFWDCATAFFCFGVGDLTWLIVQQLKQIFFGEAYEESFLCVCCSILFGCLLLVAFFLISYINLHLWELWLPPRPRTFRRIFTDSLWFQRQDLGIFGNVTLWWYTEKLGICVEPGRAWNLQSFARPRLVISVWLQMNTGEVGWGGKCWLCSGVLLNRNFRSIDSLFFFGARNLMMAYLWCLPVMFFPPEGVPSTSPYTTLFWIATFEGQWLKRVQTSETAVLQHLTLLPSAFYLEQGDRTYLELVLMLYYEILRVEIIASWSICSGLLLGGSYVLWWKRVRTRNRAWTKGRRVSGILGLWLCWCETC